MYLDFKTVLSKNVFPPKTLDSINFNYKGIQFHVYGILHGLSGGTNQEYVQFVNDSISQSTGIIMGEKSMQQMYQKINYEVEDWLQVPFMDGILLTFNLFKTPYRLFKIFAAFFKEKITKKDRFQFNYIKRFQDIGGSPYFHLLTPLDRRLASGFPSPKDYFHINIQRRKYNNTLSSPVMSDPDWFWLSYIEKYANIPYRSIHMIEYAVLIAQSLSTDEVSLFVGENHNSDIQWYVSEEHSEQEKEVFSSITQNAHNVFYNKFKYWSKKSLYYFSISIGFILSLFYYSILFYIGLVFYSLFNK